MKIFLKQTQMSLAWIWPSAITIDTSILIFIMIHSRLVEVLFREAAFRTAMHSLASSLADLMKLPPLPPVVSAQAQRIIDQGVGGSQVGWFQGSCRDRLWRRCWRKSSCRRSAGPTTGAQVRRQRIWFWRGRVRKRR